MDPFLARAGWGDAAIVPLAGDASSRVYHRLAQGGRTAVLVQDDPAGLARFLYLARHLTTYRFSAPRVLALEEPAGRAVLEDLGDGLFARWLADDPAREADLYAAATDVLVALQRLPLPDVPAYGAAEMVTAIAPAFDWYARAAGGDPAALPAAQDALAAAFADLPDWQPTLALRDYHAENLFWLPERTGLARVGLIDFQDAVLSHPLYDLVSLLRDIRRDVTPATQNAMHARFAAATGQDETALRQAAAVLGAQRNLRILGIFARLALKGGKRSYAAHLPQVRARLDEDLAHPALAPLRSVVEASLPAPTPPVLKRLEDSCRTP